MGTETTERAIDQVITKRFGRWGPVAARWIIGAATLTAAAVKAYTAIVDTQEIHAAKLLGHDGCIERMSEDIGDNSAEIRLHKETTDIKLDHILTELREIKRDVREMKQ